MTSDGEDGIIQDMETNMPADNERITEAVRRAGATEASAVLMMLQLSIPAQEVADWTMDARRRREAMEHDAR